MNLRLMTRKQFIVVSLIIGSILMVIVGSNVAYLVHQNAAAGNKVIVTSSMPSPVAPPPPVPSSQVVASKLQCGGFTNIEVSGGVQGLVLDEGSCYIGSTKYAIDTFQTKAGRNLWLKMAEPYGVVPKWETDTAVVYKSVNS